MTLQKRVIVRYVCLLAGVVVCGALLLHTSQNVQRKEAELASLKKSLLRERQSVEVLRAEWAHLNSPYRLEDLAQRYLGMVPPSADQIMPDPDLLPVDQQDVVFDDGGSRAMDEGYAKAGFATGVDDVPGDAGRASVFVKPGRKPSAVKFSSKPVAESGGEGQSGLKDGAGANGGVAGDDLSGLLKRLGGAQ